MTAIRERPIQLKGSEVRAILGVHRTIMRRVCKATGAASLTRVCNHGNGTFGCKEGIVKFTCPYGKTGDRLWLREGWTEEHPLAIQRGRYSQPGQSCIVGQPNVDYRVIYRADGEPLPIWRRPDNQHPYFSPECPTDEIAARYPTMPSNYSRGGKSILWRASTCMPRWASRITLEITDIRMERLHDITPQQAISEDLVSGSNIYWRANSWVWVVEFKQVKP